MSDDDVSDDPITDEIRAIRRKLAAECDNDLDKIMAETRRREIADGRTYITLPPRRVTIVPPNEASASVEMPSEPRTSN